ncbi:MAG: cyclase family protein [Allomuricauda sp.]|nr:MAG: cyclase family protein [Allomuricauda sp.]
MIATLKHKGKNLKIDFSKPIDIAIPMTGNETNINAWYVDSPKIEPHREGDFVGSVAQGASTNFNDINFNPHAHVTHTECVGHITKKVHSVNQVFDCYFFIAELITVAPEKKEKDFVISQQQLAYALGQKRPQAVVIRTLPNTNSKMQRQYSNTNPPYLLEAAASWLSTIEVEHLLVDLPSVDREKDEGALLSHKAFWHSHGKVRSKATITEFIFVPNEVRDGTYLLNLQLAPFENDASPSRPVLYKLIK